MKPSVPTASGLQARTHYNPKNITARRLSALVLGGVLGLAGCASQPEPAPPPEPEPVAQPTPRARPEPVRAEVRERAPERYTVKRGDTLWDIATLFLKDPWLWPEIWQVNPQIENPHLIYPGDVIVIFYYQGQAHLRIERDGEVYSTTLDVQKVSPKARITSLEDALPVIPIDVIRPFLGHPSIIDEETAENAPYVMASVEGRLLMGSNNRAYIRRIEPVLGQQYNIIRLGQTYRDPNKRRNILGYEAVYIGTGTIVTGGDPATMLIGDTDREVTEGDLLIPIDDSEFDENILPRPPSTAIDATIIAVQDGLSQIGQFHVVVVDAGANDGLEVGNVLGIWQAGSKYRDTQAKVGDKRVDLPDQRAGAVLLFRIYDNLSYGIVMRATTAVKIGDAARTPTN